MDPIDAEDVIDEEPPQPNFTRSRSVPPELDSPTLKRRELPVVDASTEDVEQEVGSFGAGGRLTSSRKSATQFGVYIEGKTTAFELSVVDLGKADLKVFDGRDELEAASVFDKGKVDYKRFLNDESIVHDERLVIRWAGGQ